MTEGYENASRSKSQCLLWYQYTFPCTRQLTLMILHGILWQGKSYIFRHKTRSVSGLVAVRGGVCVTIFGLSVPILEDKLWLHQIKDDLTFLSPTRTHRSNISTNEEPKLLWGDCWEGVFPFLNEYSTRHDFSGCSDLVKYPVIMLHFPGVQWRTEWYFKGLLGGFGVVEGAHKYSQWPSEVPA